LQEGKGKIRGRDRCRALLGGDLSLNCSWEKVLGKGARRGKEVAGEKGYSGERKKKGLLEAKE